MNSQTSTTPSPSTPSSSPAPARRDSAMIGAGTKIKGELQAEEDLLIEGSFTGTLLLQNNLLTIGGNGQVNGSAYAKTVVVEGHIEGDLYAAERISIRKGAKVKGNISSPRVSLEDGANLRGSVEMDPDAIKEAIQAKFGDQNRSSAASSTPGSNTTNFPKRDASSSNTGNKDNKSSTEATAASK